MKDPSRLHRELDDEFRRRFRLLRQLGEGGAGVVYLAEQLELGRKVAIKFLRPEGTSPEEALARFLVEAESLSRIRHEHILEIYGLGRTGELAYMVLEYLEEGSLSRLYAERAPLPWKEAVGYALAVGKALVHAHGHGLAHRDVKPSNVLLGSGGLVKLGDFGLAKWAQSREKPVTREGVIMGSPLYLSPEQARGEAVGAATDLYSLGVCLYEGLAGRAPFTGAPVAILLKHHSQEAPRPSRFVGCIPKPLEDEIMRTLQKDPKDRHASMAAFVASLEALLEKGESAEIPSGERSAARSPLETGSTEQTLRGLDSKSWARRLGAGMLFLAVCLLLLLGLWPSAKERRLTGNEAGETKVPVLATLRLRRIALEGSRWVMRAETKALRAGSLLVELGGVRHEWPFRSDDSGQVAVGHGHRELEAGLKILSVHFVDEKGGRREGHFEWGSQPRRLAEALDRLSIRALCFRLLEAARTGGLDEEDVLRILDEERACRLWRAFLCLAPAYFVDESRPMAERLALYRALAPTSMVDAFLELRKLPPQFRVEWATRDFLPRTFTVEKNPQASRGSSVIATWPAMREVLFPTNLDGRQFAMKWSAMRRFAPDLQGKGQFEIVWPAGPQEGRRFMLELRLRENPPDFLVRLELNGQLPLYLRFPRKTTSEIGSLVNFLAEGSYDAGWPQHRVRVMIPTSFLRGEGENRLAIEGLAVPGAEASVFPMVKWIAIADERAKGEGGWE